MRRVLKGLAKDVLGVVNAYPTALTDEKKLIDLIEKLHPISPGVDFIRLGPAGDGGYVVPNDLSGIEACFSPGVADTSGFEKDGADLGLQVFLADKSVDRPAIHHNNFHFIKKYIGAVTSDEFMTIDDWVDSSPVGSNSDLMLQMDIEGYEYEVFLGMSSTLIKRFRVIVAEFHQLEQLWSQPFFNLASRVFEKILQSHTCVHVHPNNYSPSWARHGLDIAPLTEFTFLRTDRVSNPSFASLFPHPLDTDNSKSNPSFQLPKCWYRER